MGHVNDATIRSALRNPYSWLIVLFISILYYTSFPQALVYRSFPRVGGTIWRWSAVHDVVADAYVKVCVGSPQPV